VAILAEWTAHPARRRPRDVALVAAVTFLSAGAVLASLESLFLTALAVVFLVVAVAPFLLPTRYVISDDGVEERRLWRRKARRWQDLRRLQVGPGAALVSPFARPSWLDRYRGIIILLDGAERAEVVRLLEERVGAVAGGGGER
jgi:hypothetical protein